MHDFKLLARCSGRMLEFSSRNKQKLEIFLLIFTMRPNANNLHIIYKSIHQSPAYKVNNMWENQEEYWHKKSSGISNTKKWQHYETCDSHSSKIHPSFSCYIFYLIWLSCRADFRRGFKVSRSISIFLYV